MIEIIETPDLDLHLSEDELQYLTLKYLYKQKLLGRDQITRAEVMEYLGVDHDDTDEKDMLGINSNGIKYLKSIENRYMN